MVKKLFLLVLLGGMAALNAPYSPDDYENQINYFKSQAQSLRDQAGDLKAVEKDPGAARHLADVYKSVADGYDNYADYYRKMQKNGGDSPVLRERFHTLQANQKRAETLSRKMLQRRYQQLGRYEDAKIAERDAAGALNDIRSNEYEAQRRRRVREAAKTSAKRIPSRAAIRGRRSSAPTESAPRRAGRLQKFSARRL